MLQKFERLIPRIDDFGGYFSICTLWRDEILSENQNQDLHLKTSTFSQVSVYITSGGVSVCLSSTVFSIAVKWAGEPARSYFAGFVLPPKICTNFRVKILKNRSKNQKSAK